MFLVALVGAWMLACGGVGGAEEGELKGLEAGDVACYVELVVDGEERFLHGDFELCPGGGADASGLIGQRVRFTTTSTQVQADSCEGDPECTDTQEVPLVVTLEGVDA